MRNERVSHESISQKVLSKTREKSAPPIDGRHDKFQLGHNPMEMTKFEKACIMKEREERREATEHYIKGIQGRDGGCFHDEKPEGEVYTPNNISRSH